MKRIAEENGYGGFYMGNLYAFRSPYPSEMKEKAHSWHGGFSYVVGSDNRKALFEMAKKVDRIIMAYGNIAVKSWGDLQYKAKSQADTVKKEMKKIKPVYAFSLTSGGVPTHPLNRSLKPGYKGWNKSSWIKL